MFRVGFVVSCWVKSESCGVFHVASCRVYVCDAWGIEIHCLKTADNHKFCFILGHGVDRTKYVVSRRVGVSCWVCGFPKQNCQNGIPSLNKTNSPASVSVCALTGLTGQECLTALAEKIFLTNKFLLVG